MKSNNRKESSPNGKGSNSNDRNVDSVFSLSDDDTEDIESLSENSLFIGSDNGAGSESNSQKKIEEPLRPEYIIENMRNRLIRRNELIGTIRKAYLRDIVSMKQIYENVLTSTERSEVMIKRKEMIKDKLIGLPSLDLRQTLELYGPSECSLEVIPCSECGGHCEIVHRESAEMERLSKLLENVEKRDEDLRLKNATQLEQLERVGQRLAEIESSHAEEVFIITAMTTITI